MIISISLKSDKIALNFPNIEYTYVMEAIRFALTQSKCSNIEANILDAISISILKLLQLICLGTFDVSKHNVEEIALYVSISVHQSTTRENVIYEMTGLLQKADIIYTMGKERHTFILRKKKN